MYLWIFPSDLIQKLGLNGAIICTYFLLNVESEKERVTGNAL